MSDFTVKTGELTNVAANFTQLRSKADQLLATLQGVPLSNGDFGRVPLLNTRTWEAYKEHTDACAESLTMMANALSDVSEGLDATAAAYRISDEAAEQAAQYITSHMEAGPE